MSSNYGFGSITLNTGSLSGNGYQSIYSSRGDGVASGSRVPSTMNINIVTRDLANLYGADIDKMNDYFNEGDIDQALQLYQELFEDAQLAADKYGYELSELEKQNVVSSAFEKRTNIRLNEQINNQAKSSFMTGLIEGIPLAGWLFANANSKDDARAATSGRDASPLKTAEEIAGASVSSAAGIIGLGLAKGAIVSAPGVVGTIFGATGIKALAAGSAKIVGAVAGSCGILPVVGAAVAIGAAVVIGKQLLSKLK